jgi:leucyl-tRNA synthetase
MSPHLQVFGVLVIDDTDLVRLQVAWDIPEDKLRAVALADEKVQAYTDGKQVVKVVIVPQRLVNIVVK